MTRLITPRNGSHLVGGFYLGHFWAQRISRLENTISRMQRNAELVISGIPPVADESCTEIVNKIGAVIGFGNPSEPLTAFRLKKTGTQQRNMNDDSGDGHTEHQRKLNQMHPIILVKFGSPNDKSKFIGKYLAHKTLCLKDVGFQS
ncbi:hypothetical protein Bhyg_04316 [Pseudolycoriella hygida]|uniref:Uncharacterized protein n=2 Tax=Pseudolycoriella hygida TaxID=35572 RepID=A0A9Q0NF43_9DIPT|nr:hypothetical protein Bhyg_04316 [Pseudolycoriella hygida]